jgi:nucleotide-binding universal stress UspA family protein
MTADGTTDSLARAAVTAPGLAASRVSAPGAPSLSRCGIRTVLCATDLTSVSCAAQEQAIDLCASLGARLLVVNVIDPGDATRDFPSRATRIDQHKAERQRPMMAIIDSARRRRVDSSFLLWTGEPGQGIVAAAEAEGADLIVVGTRGLDRAGRFLLGSVSDYVVDHARCPVLVSR